MNEASSSSNASRGNDSMKSKIIFADERSRNDEEEKIATSASVLDYSDPFSVSELINELDSAGRFGSVSKEMLDLINLKEKILCPFKLHQYSNVNRETGDLDVTGANDKSLKKTINPQLPIIVVDSDDEDTNGNSMLLFPHLKASHDSKVNKQSSQDISLHVKKNAKIRDSFFQPVILDAKVGPVNEEAFIQSSDVHVKASANSEHASTFGAVDFNRKTSRKRARKETVGQGSKSAKGPKAAAQNVGLVLAGDPTDSIDQKAGSRVLSLKFNEEPTLQVNAEPEPEPEPKEINSQIPCSLVINTNRGIYIGVQDDNDNPIENEEDDIGEIWTEMSSALDCMKDISKNFAPDGHEQEKDYDCDHSFILKDDLGYVCRVCGKIDRRIDTIIDIQFFKGKNTRTYAPSRKNDDSKERVGLEFSNEDSLVEDITPHPRHMKLMKSHQLEGFMFLCKNLAANEPGGCIMAHAPGSGKTFMIISFIQSFLAKDPNARPLVVMPKGLLPTWKREFSVWQIEDIPIYDFYSVKADTRCEQLEVLNQWIEEKSILFLGYKQFSSIVCGEADTAAASSCQEILLKRPSIMVLDEGHTPRNEDTDVLQSISKVQTPLKVVLSGTLYQNHVKEVFNILRLVRPTFLELNTSQEIIRRILSKVSMPPGKKVSKSDLSSVFFDTVEATIHMDENFKRKIAIIKDLREMTSDVLHYYKGDFLDELPGLVDFTVVLNLSSEQTRMVRKLKQYKPKFKRNSVGSAVYLHPKLSSCTEETLVTDIKIENLLENCDLNEGAKVKFYLRMLNLCVLVKEKLLVFSQFLPPLKFLEIVTKRLKGWKLGQEMFAISGDSSMEQREISMEQFNSSPKAKVFFGSIKACGEGISLIGASRILILDVHLNPAVTRQAIGRAFRPGQTRKVFVYRLIAGDSPEEEDHSSCFKKEVIAKMWFEWNEHWDHRKLKMERVDAEECGDCMLEDPLLRQDVRSLYKRYL